MRYLIAFIVLALAVSAYAINIDATLGEVTDLGNLTITPYAMVKGTIEFRIGTIVWYPEEIWIVPSGTVPDMFKSTGDSNGLSSNATGLGKCITNIYYNSSIGYAYKVTASNIKSGSFCAAITSGSYEVLAK